MGKGDFRIHISHCHYGTDRPRIADATPAMAMHGFFDQRAWVSPISRQSESRPALDEAGLRSVVDETAHLGRRAFAMDFEVLAASWTIVLTKAAGA